MLEVVVHQYEYVGLELYGIVECNGFLFMPKNIKLIAEDSLTSKNLYSG